LITRIISGVEWRSKSSYLRSPLHSSLTSSPLGPNIFLSTLKLCPPYVFDSSLQISVDAHLSTETDGSATTETRLWAGLQKDWLRFPARAKPYFFVLFSV
jgi:hypothetical protein